MHIQLSIKMENIVVPLPWIWRISWDEGSEPDSKGFFIPDRILKKTMNEGILFRTIELDLFIISNFSV